MADKSGNNFNCSAKFKKRSTVPYLQMLEFNSLYEYQQDSLNFKKIVSVEGREKTAKKLMASLRTASMQAWNKTEALLSDEIKRHCIDPKLINPWEITADAFGIYEQVLYLYTQQIPKQKLST